MTLSVQNRDRLEGGMKQQERTVWEKLLLYVRTARYLEPVQIYTRFRPRPRVDNPGVLPLRRVNGEWLPPIPKASAQMGRNQFRFLNQERDIASWNDPAASKLWLYNLHYFEHVDSALVERWIAENPAGQGIGWDPYPTSLRVANWCKWILGGARPAAAVYRSLAVQASWIAKRLERHLLANHLLANAKALAFAGAVFEGQRAQRWLNTGIYILNCELPRQILADGAHVERSPMYHSIVLEDLLDLCNLRRAFTGALPGLSGCVSRMLGWLERMTHPDGEISFFNDAALGIAPRLDALKNYAMRLGIWPARLELGDSGYRRLDNGRTAVIFDSAPLGPDYQPGHGHADALSFEVSFRNRRVLVNSGTSTYAEGSERSFEVGTSAHNTVRIDDTDQSEMWGAFRVARRAVPFDLKTDNKTFVEAAHNGYHRLRPRITHRRRIELAGDGLVITDWVEGSGKHKVELFLHVAPGAMPSIQLDPRMTRTVVASKYRIGFNSAIPSTTVVGTWFGSCPVRFETRISLCELNETAAEPFTRRSGTVTFQPA
jgi:hypothetical protein